MEKEVLNFIKTKRVCVLSTLCSENTIHGATLHFSHTEEPFVFFFFTDSETRKCAFINQMGKVAASLVIGFSEEEMKTFQADGNLEIIKDEQEKKIFEKLHFSKHPHTEKYKDDPTAIYLKFYPTWWRFTDWNYDPKKIINNE